MKKITIPLDKKTIASLRAGDEVLLSGVVYTARDQAHKKLLELISKKKVLPFDLKGSGIYYCGPTATKPGKPIGSCGPTTSARMDKMAAPLLAQGLKVMIGKGRRSDEVRKLVKKHKAVYFLAVGGAGAYLAQKVVSATLVCFKELGPEAIYRLKIKDFPVIVGIDSRGMDVFKNGAKK